MKKILVTGGGGYVGSVLVPVLLDNGFKVSVIDLFIYGEDVLKGHQNLKKYKIDIRNKDDLESIIPGHDIVIHLACISNDPSFELNPSLGKSINLDAFTPLVSISKKNNVKRFIYASSSSVYGVKKIKDVSEDLVLEPLTDYSKFKAECEKILQDYNSADFTTVTLRPATVCGYSPRQRLDVVVNIFANLAYNNRKITIFGGNQLRPNIHIFDMVEAYIAIIKAPKEKVNNKIFNVGDKNYTVSELAKMTKETMGDDVELITSHSDDNRSYHISSKKIFNEIGFKTSYSVKDAVLDLKKAMDQGKLYNSLENPLYFNIKQMQKINLK